MIFRSPFFFFLLVESLPLPVSCWAVVCWSPGCSSFVRCGAPGGCVLLEGGGWLASGVPVPLFTVSISRLRLPVAAGFVVAAGGGVAALVNIWTILTALSSLGGSILGSPAWAALATSGCRLNVSTRALKREISPLLSSSCLLLAIASGVGVGMGAFMSASRFLASSARPMAG